MRYVLCMCIVLVLSASASAFADSGSPVRYHVNGLDYEGYYISPEKGVPLVLLLHDWDGLTEYEVTRANMLAKQGYAVFAADLFGAGIRPTKVKDRKEHTGELYRDRKKMRALMAGALEKAASLGANIGNAVAAGYCFGGAAVLELARSGTELKGFVLFHGGLSTPDGQDYSRVRGEVLVMHGTADEAISMASFTELATALESAGVAHELITYGGAPHAFTVYGSNRYRPDADRRSWERFLGFLREKTR
ncbi:dienelactone hydrolase family protein [Desulfoluna spongiiphila]|uniref:dienelactone hydrolase family protein n=1 Tax=Desulfoluna spongiiphila TaxID=419481 RepID=UPI001254AB89|nr:dienelactone hydrolase family protein [Desulfoluna spongiiphila]VVS95437.1 alpha/beta hydrolase fold [Desulfoluna spongiiphila]